MSKTIKGMRAPDIKKLYGETVDDINKIKSALNYIEERKREANISKIEISGEDGNGGILLDVKQKQLEATEKLGLIQKVYADVYGDEGNEGLKAELNDLLGEFNETQEKIKSTERDLYGHSEKTPEGGEKHVDGLVDKIKNFFELQKKKYSETFDKIENELLAGATTVGLSKAYEDKANSYSKPNRYWLLGFFASVAAVVGILWLSLNDVNNHFFTNMANLENQKNQMIVEYFIIKSVIRIGIITSLVWVATFTGKRYSQNKRLSEEYSYKATFAKSFEGYRKRAAELDQLNETRDLSNQLMTKMIEMSAINPVETMESNSHKEDHPTVKLLEKSINTIEKSVNVLDKMKK
jgi:hypothetical protein